jgi:hypothetical protein
MLLMQRMELIDPLELRSAAVAWTWRGIEQGSP